MKGDCIKCFQTTKHNRRHCEECLGDMRYKRRVKTIREKCHPDNRWMFPEVFEDPECLAQNGERPRAEVEQPGC